MQRCHNRKTQHVNKMKGLQKCHNKITKDATTIEKEIQRRCNKKIKHYNIKIGQMKISLWETLKQKTPQQKNMINEDIIVKE